eukprot:TRINITY_DN20218_c0_g1_i1.p1 TRINITY_DN20218_c0_g1~~TRINITY_DN20218_c0_g1_i1.p1  ORF type:complete len:416 (-),score=61.36 TRINITY_DN20218_c0_g1_i1:62-1309(-)
MEEKALIVRLRTRDGTERINAFPYWSVRTLQKKIEQNLGVPVEDQELSLARDFKTTMTSNKDKRLDELNFRNGQMVYLNFPDKYLKRRAAQIDNLKGIKQKWDLKSLMEHYDSKGLVFRNQEYAHCQKVSLDFNACNVFQMYLQYFAFNKRRVGYLYGSFDTEGTVKVDVIFEPSQEGSDKSVMITSTEEENQMLDKLADLLGLQRVGWVFLTTNPDFIMSAGEIVQTSEMHAKALKKYGDIANSFVACTVSVGEEGTSHFEAYQVTDQAVKLYKNNMFIKPDNSAQCKLKEKVLMFRKGAGKQEADVIDVDVMLKPVALDAEHKSKFSTKFPVENRAQSQSLEDLKKYLEERSTQEFLKVCSDFHFLYYLAKAKHLDIDTASEMPALCKAITSNDTQASAGFRLLIRTFAGLPI